MKKRVFLTLLVALVVVGIVVAGVLAYTATLNNTYNVKASDKISLWTDATCTTPVTSIAWGDVQKGGDPVGITIAVRNDGDAPVTIAVTFTGLATGMIASYSVFPNSIWVGDVAQLILVLQANNSASLGTGSFTAYVTSSLA